MINDLKSFATSVRKWSRHLTDFPTDRFQTHDWQVKYRSVLKEIYSHLCLTDVSVKTALVDTGPRPFVLQCSTPRGGLCDIPGVHGSLVSEILIEARVDLAAGRLTSAEWLQPTATYGGLRIAARLLEAALVPGCISGRRMVRISFAPRSSTRVPFSAISPEFPDVSSLLFLTYFSTLDHPQIVLLLILTHRKP